MGSCSKYYEFGQKFVYTRTHSKSNVIILLQLLCFQKPSVLRASNTDSSEEQLADAVRRVWRAPRDRFVAKWWMQRQSGDPAGKNGRNLCLVD